MDDWYSRKEKQKILLAESASLGNFDLKGILKLSKEEIAFWIIEGLRITPYLDSREKVLCDASWEYVYENGIPLFVERYINGLTNHCPNGLSFGQKLFTIAARNVYLNKNNK